MQYAFEPVNIYLKSEPFKSYKHKKHLFIACTVALVDDIAVSWTNTAQYYFCCTISR